MGRRALLLSVLLPAITRAEPAWGLEALMAELRGVRASSARFVEKQHLRMLTEPLQSSGRLAYVAPDRLWKETLEPRPARMAVEGDRLMVQLPGEAAREMSLREQPEIGALVASIRSTLAGDLPALRRYYAVSLEGGRADWRLALQPLDARLRSMIASIVISGSGAAVRFVETRSAEGDRTEMTILPDDR
jgi:hypothetical protein